MTPSSNISVSLKSNRLRLEQALKKAGIEDLASVTKLTVTGMPTFGDFWFIRENMGKTLQEFGCQNRTVRISRLFKIDIDYYSRIGC